jgi:hypothetical protein
MKPAVIMMFRDEADILGKCLEHWYALGVRDFYLCDNASEDDSFHIAKDFFVTCPARHIIQECWQTDWPGRAVINDLKRLALADGCDWIFPADADEFLALPEGYTIGSFLEEIASAYKDDLPGWLELPYRNILPDGREEWQEPQRKCFGSLTPEMTISMGNHLIEGIEPMSDLEYDPNLWDVFYRHYSLRTYPQFKRKMENYMTAFSQNGFSDHHHAESFKIWQVEGESYLQRLWTELTGLPCE